MVTFFAGVLVRAIVKLTCFAGARVKAIVKVTFFTNYRTEFSLKHLPPFLSSIIAFLQGLFIFHIFINARF